MCNITQQNNQRRHIRRRRISTGRATASTALILPQFPPETITKMEQGADLTDFLLDAISLLSNRVKVDFSGKNLKDCLKNTFARLVESLDDPTRPRSMRGRDIIELDGVFVQTNLYHDRLDGIKLPGLLVECAHDIRICEIGDTMYALREISASLPAYVMHALDQSPVRIYTGRDYINYATEFCDRGDPGNDPSRYDDDDLGESVFSVNRVKREWPAWTLGRDCTPREIPEALGKLCETVKAAGKKLREENIAGSVDYLCYFDDVPAAFLAMSEEDPSSDAIRDQILEFNADDAMCSPIFFSWGEDIDRFCDNLKTFLSAASATGKILEFLNPAIGEGY